MELKFSKIVNKELKRVEILLSGVLGDDNKETNGHYWAQEFRWLDKNYDQIDVLINSDGGSIVHGLSIVAAILGATSKVTTRTIGIAASMSAVVAVLGDTIEINDYAKLMFHSPYYEDENGDKAKNLSAKDKKALSVIKDVLVRLLMKCGKSEEEITSILKTDTWYSAEEALVNGYVDSIIATGRKKELVALEPMALVAKLNDEYKPKKERKMKTVIAALGLPEDTEEQAVLEAVNKLQKDGGNTPDLSKVVDKLIVVAKAHNKVTDKNEASMRKLADTDFGLFMDVLNLEEVEAPAGGKETTRISEVLAALGKGKGTGSVSKKTFAWYEQNDPDALAKMEVSEPEKFKALLDADIAQY